MAPKQSDASKSHPFRPDIEGLRGLAVLLVVLFHAKVPGFGGGYIGVDVFFVLSGYLITGLLVSEIEKTGRISLLSFYARRARRLLPVSAVVILAVLVASWLLLSPIEITMIARTARAAALYLANIWFMLGSTDYFAADAHNNPLLHMWSLSVEEQFYFVWPALVLLARRATPSRARLLWFMASMAVLSFLVSVWFTSSQQPIAFYGPHARAWEFAVGAIAVILPPTTWRRIGPASTW